MSRNIEIKAELSLHQYHNAVACSEQITGMRAEILTQKDTFFNAPKNRLKLRQFPNGGAELIGYARRDQDDPVASQYFRTSISRPNELLQGLELTLGVRGIVEKTRLLFIYEQTRIHLDEVKELGHFLELEVVLDPNQSDAWGIEKAETLMQQLGISKEQLVSCAYIDLLEQKPGS